MATVSLAARLRPSLLAPVGLLAGFAVARSTGRRQVGGALFGLVGAVCVRDWARASGWPVTAGLAGAYVAAMGGSHPLAKRIGAWPAVGAVSAAIAVASIAFTGRRRSA